MSAFFSTIQLVIVCGSLLFIAMLVLLSLPQSKLRCVGLELAKWALCAGLALLTVSPLDVIPDVVPVAGWLDDIGYIVAAIAAARSAMADGKKRKLYDEIELNNLQNEARREDRR